MLGKRRLAAMATMAVLAASSSPALAAQACPEVGFTLVEAKASASTRPVTARNGTIQVRREALTRTADIVEVRLQRFEHAQLLLKFRPEAAERLEAATTNHDGLRLAFVADDAALLSVVWQGPYGMGRDGAQVSIADVDRAQRLFDRLSACVGPAVPGR